ncbi:MAG TPA: DHA2 family efflux MFS transporter permease subunit [Acidimicrobiales bacterium]|nr:DHA2 family efflux MFS transporter permease subunit [Acidimicrobiales bacterium]
MNRGNESGFTRRRRYAILAICSMSLLMVGLDVTIVNVALPSIGHSFHAPLSGLAWTIDAYTLVLASLLMLSGSTADRLGRRRTFVSGLAIFAAGSLLCSVAPNLGLLIVFRMVQAVGGSMLNPVAMSIITNTFTDARERAQAIGVWAAVIGVSMALGPVLGGVLVSSVGWQSIFWVNVPVALVAVALALRFIPESKAPVARRVDLPGQLLVILFLASLTYGIIEAPQSGWTSTSILGSLVVAVASLVAFTFWERRTFEPLVDLRFFRSIPFASATLIAVAAFAGLGGFLFLNTIYLQNVRGLSPFHAGLDTLPMAVMVMLLPPVSGRILSRRGSRIPLLIAGVTLAASCLMLVDLGPTTSFTWLFGSYLVFGIGFGFVNAPITNTAVSGMPRAQAGVAAAIASTSRQIGATVGVAVVGSLAASSLHQERHPSFSSASHPGWWVLTGCGVAILVIGLAATSSSAKESARATAVLINPEFLEETPA